MNVVLNSHGIQSISDFFRTLQSAIRAQYGETISFTAAYPGPSEEYNTPIITYYFRQVPGSFSQTKELKPRFAQTVEVDTNNGGHKTVSIYRQRFEYTIVFEVWHYSGSLADELADTFRKYITSLTPFFQSLGLMDLIFMGMDGTKPENLWKTDLVRREMTYLAVMDEITNVTDSRISAFDISGYVYQSIYHLLDRDGTPIPQVRIEEPSSDTIAAISYDAADVSAGVSDSIVIQLQ